MHREELHQMGNQMKGQPHREAEVGAAISEEQDLFQFVKEGIVVVCLIRVSTIVHEDVFYLATTVFPFQSYANNITGRGHRG